MYIYPTWSHYIYEKITRVILYIQSGREKIDSSHLVLMSLLGIFNVQFLTYISDSKFESILFHNYWISIDYWFLIHVLNTNLIVWYYSKCINLNWYLLCVFGWEIIENIIIPNLNHKLAYFRETPQNFTGDIIAAIPAYGY